MISARVVSAFAAAAMAGMAAAQCSPSSKTVPHIATPSVIVKVKEIEDVGCFNAPGPLDNYGYHEFQSQGNCQLICAMLDKPVMALSDGEDCSCGDLLPPKSAMVDMSKCDTICISSKVLPCKFVTSSYA